MWIADNWKDYEVVIVLTEKNWNDGGDYLLVRPRSSGNLEHEKES